MDSSIIAALISSGVALLVGYKLHQGQAKIEVKVDGRLEAALQKIDHLEELLSVSTGKPAPPPVAGQSGGS